MPPFLSSVLEKVKLSPSLNPVSHPLFGPDPDRWAWGGAVFLIIFWLMSPSLNLMASSPSRCGREKVLEGPEVPAGEPRVLWGEQGHSCNWQLPLSPLVLRSPLLNWVSSPSLKPFWVAYLLSCFSLIPISVPVPRSKHCLEFCENIKKCFLCSYNTYICIKYIV